MKIYDPTQIQLVICGVPISSGFAPGSFVEVRQTSPSFNLIQGVDGQTTRTKTNDFSARIIVKLMQSSDANTLLSLIWNYDVFAYNGAGVGPSSIKDSGGSTQFVATKSWIEKPPDADFGDKATSREWIIACAQLSRLDGASNQV